MPARTAARLQCAHITLCLSTQRPYWFDPADGSWSYDRPDAAPERTPREEETWREFADDDGKKYWYSAATGEWQYTRPSVLSVETE